MINSSVSKLNTAWAVCQNFNNKTLVKLKALCQILTVNKMLMNNGPWSPEHIYQEIAGYSATRQRGKSLFILRHNFVGGH